MARSILVSGVQPSGKLHVGNYLGAIRNFVELQNSGKYDCYFFVADYHSLTENFEPKQKTKDIKDLVIDFLAAGLDPKKSTIFIQSHIPEHANLAWIFNTIVQMGELQRMVEYKEKVDRGIVPNVGLFNYPVLMAADILIYGADVVPVGEDQRQHLELARDIARRFNGRFGKVFKEPKALLTRTPRVMSLADPQKKMSKSVPVGCLYLSDSREEIKEKIKRAVTDSLTKIGFDSQNRPGISNLLMLYSEFSGLSIEKILNKYESASYSEFKNDLADVIYESLSEFQKEEKQ